MALFNTLLMPTDENARATLYALLKTLRLEVTRSTVRESLEQHPDFPSLLSLSDVLTDWQVENTGLQLNTVEQLRELPLPFVAHLRKNNGWYVLVTALKGDAITYTDNERGRRTESLADFEKNWSGVVLLAERLPVGATEQRGDANYAARRKDEQLENLRGSFLLASLLLMAGFVLLSAGPNFTTPAWLLLLTKSMGLWLSSLLVAKSLGSQNAFTDRLCQINRKTNCDDVLNSPAAKLWGWLPWADVGLLYFAGGVLAVGVSPLSPAVLQLLYWAALLALPYTVFSIYYQGVVLRQWCPLCFGVQGVLLVEGVMAVTQLIAWPVLWQPYGFMLMAFLIPATLWVSLKPLLAGLSKSRQEHTELMHLKRDSDLFQALLRQQPPMPSISAGLHPIVLGNPKAEHTITMVTNPYCGPCAKVHKELKQLIRQNQQVNANIIFTCDGTDGLTTQVAVHLMALNQQGNIAEALAEWYEQPEKNFDAWARKYPIMADSMDWVAIADRHRDWCLGANITVTPTLFADGNQLPTQYRLTSLKWLINTLEPMHKESKISV